MSCDVRRWWLHLAEEIFADRRARTGCVSVRLHAVAAADYPTAAARPAASTLDSARFRATFAAAAIDWRAGLKDVVRALPAHPGGQECRAYVSQAVPARTYTLARRRSSSSSRRYKAPRQVTRRAPGCAWQGCA